MNRYVALLKVVEVGSFTKAAEILGYTQPAMSQMIASLENELSINLLYRSRYGVRLTPEGERLLPSIQSAVAQYQSMQNIAGEIRGLESGVVRIGTISSISCHWLPPVIKQFWQKYPNVQLIVHQGDYTTIPEWVRTGELDFGFVTPDAVQGTDSRFLKYGEHRACLPKDHPLARLPAVPLKVLANEAFLLLEEGIYSEPLAAFRAFGLEPNIRMTMHDDYSILSMVEQGLGVTILPELVLRKQNYDIVMLPTEPMIMRRISIISRNENEMSIAAKRFIDFLLKCADNLP
ncbi:MAG: LysR family transcriptional regulator [Oscillospiraceae bacterium]|nr:LysR family transcriptional regulator [Oscillospiraceae bacterium]